MLVDNPNKVSRNSEIQQNLHPVTNSSVDDIEGFLFINTSSYLANSSSKGLTEQVRDMVIESLTPHLRDKRDQHGFKNEVNALLIQLQSSKFSGDTIHNKLFHGIKNSLNTGTSFSDLRVTFGLLDRLRHVANKEKQIPVESDNQTIVETVNNFRLSNTSTIQNNSSANNSLYSGSISKNSDQSAYFNSTIDIQNLLGRDGVDLFSENPHRASLFPGVIDSDFNEWSLLQGLKNFGLIPTNGTGFLESDTPANSIHPNIKPGSDYQSFILNNANLPQAFNNVPKSVPFKIYKGKKVPAWMFTIANSVHLEAYVKNLSINDFTKAAFEKNAPGMLERLTNQNNSSYLISREDLYLELNPVLAKEVVNKVTRHAQRAVQYEIYTNGFRNYQGGDQFLVGTPQARADLFPTTHSPYQSDLMTKLGDPLNNYDFDFEQKIAPKYVGGVGKSFQDNVRKLSVLPNFWQKVQSTIPEGTNIEDRFKQYLYGSPPSRNYIPIQDKEVALFKSILKGELPKTDYKKLERETTVGAIIKKSQDAKLYENKAKSIVDYLDQQLGYNTLDRAQATSQYYGKMTIFEYFKMRAKEYEEKFGSEKGYVEIAQKTHDDYIESQSVKINAWYAS